MIYIIDTYAWIEYLTGSKQGRTLQVLFNDKNNKLITMECCLAELKDYCLRRTAEFNKVYDIIKKNSVVLPVLISHWLEASQIKHEIRKKVKDFGLIDSILVAKQNELKCRIVSGDRHFKGMRNVVYIGN